MYVADRHPSTIAAMRFFHFDHLPVHLQKVSAPFAELANKLVRDLPDDPELTKALDKLREAKDRAVSLAAISA
jgi:hypothetical protein